MAMRDVRELFIDTNVLTHGIRHLLTYNTGDFTRFSAFITVLPLEANA